MLNVKPIFIVGFQRGGTNLVLNLLRSHPDVCSPRGETHEVFKGKGFPRRMKEPLLVMAGKLLRYAPIVLAQRQDAFSVGRWASPCQFSKSTKERVDQILFDEKLRARDLNQNRFKTEDVEYSDDEIRSARLLCKNLNGLIFLSSEFSRIYPDATFIGIVRNGYALCEGHIRRGGHVNDISKKYQLGCQQMILDQNAIPNYHIFRFEDIVSSPQKALEDILECANLSIGAIHKIRMENKKIIGRDGSHSYSMEDGKERLIWYSIDEFASHFKADVNQNQINRLTADEISTIRLNAGPVLEHFGYL